MKKTLVSALTTALVVGAASTTFAAANPFADVPADHWAYDAVSELQAKGVVNGYAVDNTFRGNQNMTRYEMAQIVAKAMAKVESGDAATKAMVDKLAAEFRDELANLGVRMDDLEARMDNVKHSGFIRYRYARTSGDFNGKDADDDFLRFRLNSAVKINNKVDGYARVEWQVNTDSDTDAARGSKLQQLWVHGKVGTTDIYAGKLNPNDKTSLAHGLIFDTEYTGAQVTFNKDAWSWTIDAGKTSDGDTFADQDATLKQKKSNTRILGTHVDYKKGNFDASLAYYNFSNGLLKNNNSMEMELANGVKFTPQLKDNATSWDVWGLALGYKFGKDFYLQGDYARASKGLVTPANKESKKDSFNVQLNYKGANANVAKSWGAYVGYHQLSLTASPHPTYDIALNGTKGWKVGVDYTFMKNVVGSIQYFDGKVMDMPAGTKDKVRKFFGQLTFSF